MLNLSLETLMCYW